MNSDAKKTGTGEAMENLEQEVKRKADLKMASRARHNSVWYGLGMMGLVGWSVVIPTLAATALGIWLDGRWPQHFSWTLTLLIAGLALGCINAWHWVHKESRRGDD